MVLRRLRLVTSTATTRAMPHPIGIRMGASTRSGIRPGRQFVAYAAPWEAIPDDGLPRHPESRHASTSYLTNS